jgi:hypothetical protein
LHVSEITLSLPAKSIVTTSKPQGHHCSSKRSRMARRGVTSCRRHPHPPSPPPHAGGGACMQTAEWILCRFFYRRRIDITPVGVMRIGGKNRRHAAGSRPSTRGAWQRVPGGRGWDARASCSAEKRFSARCNSNARASRSLTAARHPKLICIISACRLQRNAWLRLRGENVRLKRDIRRWCERNGMETRPRRDATRHTALSRSFASVTSWMAFAGFRRRSPGWTTEIPRARNWNPSFSSPPLIWRLSSRSGTRRDRDLDRGTSRRIRRALFCLTRIPMMRRIMLPGWGMKRNWNCVFTLHLPSLLFVARCDAEEKYSSCRYRKGICIISWCNIPIIIQFV